MKRDNEKHVSRPVSLNYVSVQTAVATLLAAAEGIRNPTVDISSTEMYGDQVIEVTVEGYMPKTEEEIAAERLDKRNESLEAEARDRATYERLKERFG